LDPAPQRVGREERAPTFLLTAPSGWVALYLHDCRSIIAKILAGVVHDSDACKKQFSASSVDNKGAVYSILRRSSNVRFVRRLCENYCELRKTLKIAEFSGSLVEMSHQYVDFGKRTTRNEGEIRVFTQPLRNSVIDTSKFTAATTNGRFSSCGAACFPGLVWRPFCCICTIGNLDMSAVGSEPPFTAACASGCYAGQTGLMHLQRTLLRHTGRNSDRVAAVQHNSPKPAAH
jgi:hypothetical protein